MDPLDPIDWSTLRAAGVRPEPTCEAFVASNRDVVADAASVEAAVDALYERAHEQLADDERPPDQGLAFVLAYLVERELASAGDGGTIDGPGVVSRRPTDETLRRTVVEETRVPWWLAVEWGVHYSLVIFWCYEADVPLLWRNLPPASKAAVEAHYDDESSSGDSHPGDAGRNWLPNDDGDGLPNDDGDGPPNDDDGKHPPGGGRDS